MQREANKEQSSQAFRTQDAGQPLEHVEPHQYMSSQCHWSLWPPGSRVMGYGQLGHKRVPQAENKPKSGAGAPQMSQGLLRCGEAVSLFQCLGDAVILIKCLPGALSPPFGNSLHNQPQESEYAQHKDRNTSVTDHFWHFGIWGGMFSFKLSQCFLSSLK
jgi:hypothetical protein